VGKAIDVRRAKDEAAAKLEGIQSGLMLTMAGGTGAFAAVKIIAAQNVKQVGDAQVGDGISLALFVDQQRKIDAGFFAENTGIVAVAEADGCQGSTFIEKGLLVFAQLRDVLAAKNSSKVAKKNDNRRVAMPQ
jgi:hypothetical protein